MQAMATIAKTHAVQRFAEDFLASHPDPSRAPSRQKSEQKTRGTGCGQPVEIEFAFSGVGLVYHWLRAQNGPYGDRESSTRRWQMRASSL
jgi:hypothetical protein